MGTSFETRRRPTLKRKSVRAIRLLLCICNVQGYFLSHCDVVAVLVGCRTSDLQVAGSSPGWAPLMALGKLLTPVCLWHRPRGDLFGWKVTAGLVETGK